MKEIDKPNWHIITSIEKFDNLVFLPFLYRYDLDVMTIKEMKTKAMKLLPEGKILFAHHAVSDMNFDHFNTNDLNELVLPKKKIKEKYQLSVMGHIHEHKQEDGLLFTGSSFTNEVGELEKFVFKINTDTLEINKFLLPNRPIMKLSNPSTEELQALSNDSIVKIFVDKESYDVESILPVLTEKNIHHLIIESSYKVREKYKEKDLDLSVDNLLKIYSDKKSVDYDKLMEGFVMIK